MSTIYFSKRDFRQDQQLWYSSHRAHAVCRKLTACVNPPRGANRPHGRVFSAWYGAHYWAACWVLRHPDSFVDAEEGKRRFITELTGGDGHRKLPSWADSLWSLALKRVRAVAEEAKALKTSLLW